MVYALVLVKNMLSKIAVQTLNYKYTKIKLKA